MKDKHLQVTFAYTQFTTSDNSLSVASNKSELSAIITTLNYELLIRCMFSQTRTIVTRHVSDPNMWVGKQRCKQTILSIYTKSRENYRYLKRPLSLGEYSKQPHLLLHDNATQFLIWPRLQCVCKALVQYVT